MIPYGKISTTLDPNRGPFLSEDELRSVELSRYLPGVARVRETKWLRGDLVNNNILIQSLPLSLNNSISKKCYIPDKTMSCSAAICMLEEQEPHWGT